MVYAQFVYVYQPAQQHTRRNSATGSDCLERATTACSSAEQAGTVGLAGQGVPVVRQKSTAWRPWSLHVSPEALALKAAVVHIPCPSLQEIATLAGCRSPFITQYHASLIPPGSTQLLIVMELLAGSVADAVRS